MGVQIDIGMFRLIDEPAGTYGIHELAVRKENSKEPGKIYVKRRHYGLSLSRAIGLLVELLPQHEEISTLKELKESVERNKAFLTSLLCGEERGAHLTGWSSKCSGCGRFFSPRDVREGTAYYSYVNGEFRSSCPRCSTKEGQATDSE